MNPVMMAAAMAAAAALRIARERDEEQKLINEGLCASTAEARRLLSIDRQSPGTLSKIRAKRLVRKE